MKNDSLVEIRLPKTTLFLTPAEINRLLAQNPALFQQAILRGKGILRARKAKQREKAGVNRE